MNFFLLKTVLFPFILFSLSVVTLNGQCTVHSIGPNVTDPNFGRFFDPTTKFGQSFTACSAGTITSISIGFKASFQTAGTHTLLITSSASPATALIGTPDYQQTFSTVAGVVGTEEVVTITFTTPFPVMNNSTYSIEIHPGYSKYPEGWTVGKIPIRKHSEYY